jgi:hypothetical protein
MKFPVVYTMASKEIECSSIDSFIDRMITWVSGLKPIHRLNLHGIGCIIASERILALNEHSGILQEKQG